MFQALAVCPFHNMLTFFVCPKLQPTPRSAALRRGALIASRGDDGDDDENGANNTIVLHEVRALDLISVSSKSQCDCFGVFLLHFDVQHSLGVSGLGFRNS